MKQNIQMQRVSKMEKGLKKETFNQLVTGFKKFSKVDHYVVGYVKNDTELLIYKIPANTFYQLSNKLLYLNNSSDKYKSLSLRLYRYSESREKLLKDFYVDSFNIKKLNNYKGNSGLKFEAFIENEYKMTHNEKDAIQYGGVDAKKSGTNYQMKLEAASMKMFREWYECNDFFYNNGWV